MIGCSGTRSSLIDAAGDTVSIGWGSRVLDSCKIELFTETCLDWLRVNSLLESWSERRWHQVHLSNTPAGILYQIRK